VNLPVALPRVSPLTDPSLSNPLQAAAGSWFAAAPAAQKINSQLGLK